MKLSDIQVGQKAVIVKVVGHGGFRRRIVEMGFIKGKVVEVLNKAPLGDPIEYGIMDYRVSLRKQEAQHIEVISLKEAEEIAKQKRDGDFPGIITEVEILHVALDKRKQIQVALVGNPNAGKTSLFNAISGQHEKVGNYSGVTVDAKTVDIEYKGYKIKLVDLPGTYSLSEYSPEEKYVRKHIAEEHPDVIVNVLDAGNLERNMFLTTQLIDMNVRMVIALNMFDELENKGDKFDFRTLSAMIGVPMVPTVSPKMKGIRELLNEVIKLYEGGDYLDDDGRIIEQLSDDKLLNNHYHEFNMQHNHRSKGNKCKGNPDAEMCCIAQKIRHIHINYGTVIESAISYIKSEMAATEIGANADYTPRYIALRLLERDAGMEEYIGKYYMAERVMAVRDECENEINKEMKDIPENVISDAKYGFIAGALRETYVRKEKVKERTWSNVIDNIVTSKYFGYPVFLLALFITFQSTFVLGAYPMEWIETGVSAVSAWISGLLPAGILRDLLVDGIIQGVGGVLVFLPNILILYFFITLMETSGYMARAAFIMDKIMHHIGLHGRSFIPLIMGFGCNVPAVMATRTIENKNARMITMLIVPLMSCSARLPIYILFAMTFFPHNAGIVLFMMYIVGVFLAALMARIFKRVLFSKEETPFVMELPPYRLPGVKVMLRDTWGKGVQYIRKIGTTILVGSIIIWALSYFPMYEGMCVGELTGEQHVEQKSESYLGQIGHLIEPVMHPLGFDWKCSVALLTGVTAKEIVISTLGILYSVDESENVNLLSDRLKAEVREDGEPLFNTAVALSFMLFVLIYVPCIGTLSTIRYETGSWLWAGFTALYTIVLAWLVSFVTYQSIVMDMWQEVLVGLILTVAVYVVTIRVVKKLKLKREHTVCDGCRSGSCSDCNIKKI